MNIWKNCTERGENGKLFSGFNLIIGTWYVFAFILKNSILLNLISLPIIIRYNIIASISAFHFLFCSFHWYSLNYWWQWHSLNLLKSMQLSLGFPYNRFFSTSYVQPSYPSFICCYFPCISLARYNFPLYSQFPVQ